MRCFFTHLLSTQIIRCHFFVVTSNIIEVEGRVREKKIIVHIAVRSKGIYNASWGEIKDDKVFSGGHW